MSLLPVLLSDCWDEFERPLGLLNRSYGVTMRPEDLFDTHSSRNSDILVYRPFRRSGRRFQPYDVQESRSHGASVVKNDKEKFHVTLDVQHFRPEEIAVKVVGNHVVVEGKHEEKEDDHGWVSRQFIRKYLIPSQCDLDKVSSSLSSDGVLAITAPRKQDKAVERNERIIQIERTGKPAVKDNKAPGQSIERKNNKEDMQPDAEDKEKSIAAA